jgi:hypothetical protein
LLERNSELHVRVSTSLSYNITKLKNKTAFKIASPSRFRGVVDCKSCLKPRRFYSYSALSQMKLFPSHVIPDNNDNTIPSMTREETNTYRDVAKDRFLDTMESPNFVCGIVPLDFDDPMYDIFQCNPSLDCNTHIEADFYTSRTYSTALPLLWRIRLSCGVTLLP